MDDELAKTAAAMKQRAMRFAGASVGQGRAITGGKVKVKPKSKPKPSPSSLTARATASPAAAVGGTMSISTYAAAAGVPRFRTKNKFGVLKMIIDKLRERHMDHQTKPLTFDEILKEINYTDMSPNMRDWLQPAVRSNEKISCKEGGKFVYKPLYSNLKNSSRLVGLLKRKEDEGLPAVLMADIKESMPRWDKGMKNLKGQVLTFTRPDKQEVVFHNDSECHLPVREDYQQIWRGISLEGLSDQNIETYLNNAGISTMKGQTLKPATHGKKKGRGAKRSNAKVLNVHLADGMLKDYSTDAAK